MDVYAMTTFKDYKAKALQDPEVKEEYDSLPVTSLNQWRLEHGYRWHDIARLLTDQGCGPVYEGRLNRLRRGKAPTAPEGKALDLMTDGLVDSFLDRL